MSDMFTLDVTAIIGLFIASMNTPKIVLLTLYRCFIEDISDLKIYFNCRPYKLTMYLELNNIG